MRIAIVSDIHANLTALEAVITDLRKTGAELVVHGGDLMGGGPRPAEVIDRVREMNWPGVYTLSLHRSSAGANVRAASPSLLKGHKVVQPGDLDSCRRPAADARKRRAICARGSPSL